MSVAQALLLDQHYHIYGHAVDGLSLFKNQRDYHRFLRLYVKYIAPVAKTYAFCLLPNHFHFFIYTFPPHEQSISDDSAMPVEPSRAFSNLFNAYARYYNLKYRRRGSLFVRPFGRKEVNSTAYFLKLIVYIHKNAEHHGLVDDFKDWPYTSYHLFFTEKPSHLDRESTLSWFSSIDGFRSSHANLMDYCDITSLIFDD